MSCSPRLFVISRKDPYFDDILKDIEDIDMEFEESILAKLDTMRGEAAYLYLGDRFNPDTLNSQVGKWVDVRERINYDLEYMRQGKPPEDMNATNFTIRPRADGTVAFKRLDRDGKPELITALQEFLDSVENLNLLDSDLFVVRSWW